MFRMEREELIKTVIETIEQVTGLKITPEQYDANLFKLGIDSLKAIQIVNALEDKLDIIIDDSNLKEFTSINAIADFFDRNYTKNN